MALDKNDGTFKPSIEGVISGKTSQVTGMNGLLNDLIGNDNYLNGKKLDKGNYTGTAEDLNNDTKSRLPYVNTIEDLKKQTKYKVGDIVEVLGYYSAGDGAHHYRQYDSAYVGEDAIKGWKIVGDINARYLGCTTNNYLDLTNMINKKIIFCGESVKIKLEPLDDIPTNWSGYGTIRIENYLGRILDYKIENLDIEGVEKFRNRLKRKIGSNINIGFVGDSITDGAYGKTQTGDWVQNPLDSTTNNFNSTNYNHSLNGGYGSWASVLTRLINSLGIYNNVANSNIASAGKRTMSDWTYRNIDYGFFLNNAYGNKVPDLVIYATGFNDAIVSSPILTVDEYYKFLKKNVQKLTMYGASVLLVLPVRPKKDEVIIATEKFAKDYDIEFIKLYEVIDMANMNLNYTYADLWKSPTGVVENVHPATEMQKIIGSFCFKELFREYIIDADFNLKVDLATDNRILNKPFILLDYSTYDNISKDVFSFGGSNVDGNFKIFVWSDIECLATFKSLENDSSTSTLFTSYNDFSSTNTKTIGTYLYGKTSQPDRRNSVRKVVASIMKGLNIIHINSKAGMFAPIMEFIKERSTVLDYGRAITRIIQPRTTTYDYPRLDNNRYGVYSTVVGEDISIYEYRLKKPVFVPESFIYISKVFGKGIGVKFSNGKIYLSYFDETTSTYNDICNFNYTPTSSEKEMVVKFSIKNYSDIDVTLDIDIDGVNKVNDEVNTKKFLKEYSCNLSGEMACYARNVNKLEVDMIEYSYFLNILKPNNSLTKPGYPQPS